MKYMKKSAAILLTILLVIGLLPSTVLAQAENTPKEEVVYVNLNHDGSVKEINVVNIFDLTTADQIVDYGSYESVRNMTTKDKITVNQDTVTIDAQAGKLYYEGKLTTDVMPWNIAIRYYMDGKEYTADEIAGMSGALKLTIDITENEDYTGNFFAGFALQATVKLDTEKCSNIKAEDATMANVGHDKQMTYTILPNTGANIVITADVTDFEMEAISINGIRLSLSIEISDEMIQEKLNKLIGAIQDVDAGAGELADGAKELSDGTELLNSNVGTLYNGVGSLATGANELSSGLSTIVKNNDTLLSGAYTAFEGLCTASETILNAQLTANGLSTVTLTPTTYEAVLSNLLKSMNLDAIYDAAYQAALAHVTAQVEANAQAIYAGYIEENADSIYQVYIQSQADTLYAQVASETVVEQLMAKGYTKAQATTYLQTEDGKALILQAVNAMTAAQKEQILTAALLSLTDAQKTQIRNGALASLTDKEKTQICQGYIEQMMKSKEVTDQITAATATANSAAASITALKGQLDNYSLFYTGLKDYTSAVSNAASGASTLHLNLDSLYTKVGNLKTSVGELNNGAKSVSDGAATLKEGTARFVEGSSGIEGDVTTQVYSVITEATGSNVNTGSFVSEKNENVDAVQFVIQTEAIEATEEPVEAPTVVEKLTFWQKLLRLFGLY